MAKILHTADIHLDPPSSLLDVQKAQVRINELRVTFTSLMMYAKTEHFDLVIISGDLFDCGFVTKETMELIVSQFEQNPDCKFVIAPGNHDPIGPKSPYKKVQFPNNVYIFDSDELSCFRFDDIGIDVYGYAFCDSKMETNPLREVKLNLNSERINILAAHADMTSATSDNCPMTVADIAASGFDYVALGHIHAGGDVKLAGHTYYAYSGCLEGRSFDECGIKGAIVCKTTTSRSGARLDFALKRFSHRRYEKFDVDITAATSTNEAIEKARRVLTDHGVGSDTVLRLTFTGSVSEEFALDARKLTAQTFGVYYLEYYDKTMPTLNYKDLLNDISIRGAFFRELWPKMKSEDEKERRTAIEAFRYGMAALSGSDIVDY
ncbi:MAG: metallophosphoesterase [Clostridia bacterium]|nr:metallophosphoesterase [Clostridia bacterium]